jgi:hypothetical protein
MNKLGSLAHIAEAVAACREACTERDIPFHADALAAALHIPYGQLVRYAAGEGTSPSTAALLSGALQECTASVLSYAMNGDPKRHGFFMWYLRNRGGFSDKAGDMPPAEGDSVTFVGEGRI